MSPEAEPRATNEPIERPARGFLGLLLAAAALHGLAYFLLLPPWMGEDEPWQLEVAHHVSRGHWPTGGREFDAEALRGTPMSQLELLRRFPTLPPEEASEYQRAVLASMRTHGFWEQVDWAGRDLAPESFDGVAMGTWGFTAANHPPLYYLALGAWLRAGLGDSVEGELYWARAFSFLLYLSEIALVYLVARELCRDSLAALGAALFAAWLPLHARQAAVVNNDVLANALTGVALWVASRSLAGRAGAREAALGLAAGALGLLAKATAASGVAALTLAFLLRRRPTRGAGSEGVRRIAMVGLALAIAAAAAWIWLGHHSPVLPKNLEALRLRVARGLALPNWRSFWETFVGRFNWESRGFAPPVYAAALAAALLLSLGELRALVRPTPAADRRAILFCAAVVLAQLALIVLRGEARGRYLLPALPALALLASTGLLALWPRRRALLAASGALALLAYDALFLWHGLVQHHHLRLGA